MNPIDAIMERASEALQAGRYLQSERLCVEALDAARAADDFDRYARIVLPLQEARRQRRQLASDHGVAVFSGHHRSAEQLLDSHDAGCLLLIDPPYTADDLQSVRRLADERDLYIEAALVNAADLRGVFEAVLERQGDAALTNVPANLSPAERVDALRGIVDATSDHELAHQQLADAARHAAKQQ